VHVGALFVSKLKRIKHLKDFTSSMFLTIFMASAFFFFFFATQVSDVRLPACGTSDPPTIAPSTSAGVSYPRQTFLQLGNVVQKCQGCQLHKAAYDTFQDPLLSSSDGEAEGGAGHFCEACHTALHYGQDGALLPELAECPEFRVFPSLPPRY